jgi:hypothetical protein
MSISNASMILINESVETSHSLTVHKLKPLLSQYLRDRNEIMILLIDNFIFQITISTIHALNPTLGGVTCNTGYFKGNAVTFLITDVCSPCQS